MKIELNGGKAIVTGSTVGIGRAIAEGRRGRTHRSSSAAGAKIG